jgi:hypothetical protein
MRPAFDSPRQAAAFAFLLLILLLLPTIVDKSILPPREQIYSSIWWGDGAFPYTHQLIYAEKGDIDIAFIGSSHLEDGIDAPYVQKMLSEKLGRPAVVRTIAWTGAGYDALYFITQDLLQHRKVHLLVTYDVYNELNIPHGMAPAWFRIGDNASDLRGLSFRLQACYYFAAIIGMPRNLLSLVRANLPADISVSQNNRFEIAKKTENIPSQLGSIASQMGFAANLGGEHAPFENYLPQTETKPSDVFIYSDSVKDAFCFESTVPDWQLHFARKFADLARDQKCRVAFLHMPTYEERRDPLIHEHEFWPQALHIDLDMVGIPSEKLFQGMTDEQILKLFSDPKHLNKNGQEYFTSVITPSLLEIYAAQASY